MNKAAPAASSKPAPEPVHTPRHLYLVDGSGYVFRAFHALPPMTRSDGTPIGAVFGFTNMLLKLLTETGAVDRIAVVFDAKARTFRNEIYAEYKANRTEMPPELAPQLQLIREAVKAFNLPCVELAGYEADDLIATYARQAAAAGDNVTIVSSDKDMMQLVGERIVMLDPIKNRPIGPAEVMERFGVPPEKVIEVQALAGDSTDNVPGVPGIGVKTAAELINSYGDLETLLARAPEIKQPKRRETLIANAENARLSRTLVTLKDDVPVEEALDSFAKREPDPQALLAFLSANEFRSTLKRVEAKLAESASLAGDGTGGFDYATARGSAAPALAAPAAEDEGAPEVRYELIETFRDLDAWIARATAAGTVALAGFGATPQTRRERLVGLALSIEPGRAGYVPLAHGAAAGQGALALEAAPEAPEVARAPEQALARLKPLLEAPGVLKVGHGIKELIAVLARHAIALAPVDDTQLASYVLGGGAHGHDCDALVEMHLGIKCGGYDSVVGTGRNRQTFDALPPGQVRDHAAESADMTLRLHRLLKPRLVQQHLTTVYETIERPLAAVVAEMEAEGVKVDREELRRLSDDFGKRLDALEGQIYKLAGREFNIGSPKQLGEVLFDELSMGAGKKGKTGAYSTGADILEELAAQGHDLPARVLDWRELSKLKNTYTDALLEEINPETGRVHTSFELAATSTGRLSSSEPNLQNIPIRTEEGRRIRRAFIAEPGCQLLSVDYSQIELRLAAHLAELPALKEAFRNGEDIHAATAAQVFGVPIKGMDPAVRRRAKAINFGIIYGISAFGLAAQLGIPQGEAKAYIEAYLARYPGIRDYMERTKRYCRERGYVMTLFGRRCHVPGINERNPARRGNAERQAINAPLQGSAADIIKRAMIRVPPALKKARLKARMLLQVHDELLFEVPESEADKTAKLIKQVMEGAALPAVELSVPLVADTGFGRSWADAH